MTIREIWRDVARTGEAERVVEMRNLMRCWLELREGSFNARRGCVNLKSRDTYSPSLFWLARVTSLFRSCFWSRACSETFADDFPPQAPGCFNHIVLFCKLDIDGAMHGAASINFIH